MVDLRFWGLRESAIGWVYRRSEAKRSVDDSFYATGFQS
jgi:hypothetical protein